MTAINGLPAHVLNVTAIASAPPTVISTTTAVTGIRAGVGGSKIASSGSNAPSVNDTAEDAAACHGFVSSCFVHFLVVLVPLTALREIVCAFWPAMRRGQIVWLTLILAVVTLVLTPITTNAGE